MSVSLAETGDLKDHRDALVELVASSEYGILHLFSHHQLQVLPSVLYVNEQIIIV